MRPIPVKVKSPFSTCEDTSTQKPWVLELWKSMNLARKKTIAAPQNTRGGTLNRILLTNIEHTNKESVDPGDNLGMISQ